MTRCDYHCDQNCRPTAYNPPGSSQVLSALPVQAGDATARTNPTGSGDPDTAGARRGQSLRPRPDGYDQTTAGSRKAPRTAGDTCPYAPPVAWSSRPQRPSRWPAGCSPCRQAVTAATQAQYADDYNGDGYRDYAFGDGGDSVTVTYGTATGPGTTSKRFTQNSAGIPGTSGDAGGYVDGLAASSRTPTSTGMVTPIWSSATGPRR